MDVCQKLIAHYLKANGYSQTLEAFATEVPQYTLEDVKNIDVPVPLPELVKLYLQDEQLSKQLSSIKVQDKAASSQHNPFDWHQDLTVSIPTRVTRTIRNIHLSGVLSVSFCQFPKRVFDTSSATYSSVTIPCIVTSSTDKRIVFTSIHDFELVDSFEPITASTLDVRLNPIFPYLMLSAGMDGSCTITDLLSRDMTVLKSHTKFVVRSVWSDDGLWFSTLSYDKTICLYEVVPELRETSGFDVDTDDFAPKPTFSYHLRWRKSVPTNPEACTFLPGSTHFVYSRRDDNHLTYVTLPAHSSEQDVAYMGEEFETSSINLNENLDAHISFSILSITVHPSMQALSLQTDTDIARIILVPLHSNQRLRHALYTSAEQSAYSNPRHAWLADGSGVAVSSDDGIIRIVDLNGKVKSRIAAHGVAAPHDEDVEVPVVGAALRARYEADRGSSVVRDLCVLPDGSIVSVGLDKTIRVAAVR